MKFSNYELIYKRRFIGTSVRVDIYNPFAHLPPYLSERSARRENAEHACGRLTRFSFTASVEQAENQITYGN